jgi:2-polyprenyl-3-methyl-5-hydroxy-6-metoxy-1,4-benzoquinol methylase
LDVLASTANSHFWPLARKQRVIATIRKYLTPRSRFLDVGVGGCDISVEARNSGFEVTLSDIQVKSLQLGAERGFTNLMQFDLYKPIYQDHFHGIGAFDVIEHLEDDKSAVSNLLKMVKPGGYIFVTVPAFPSLWNNRDVMECHKRRYRKHTLEPLFTGQGAEIVLSQYFFFSIVPLLALRALISRLFPKTEFSPDDYLAQFSINPWINRTLHYILRLEGQWFSHRNLPFGGSILLVARKT